VIRYDEHAVTDVQKCIDEMSKKFREGGDRIYVPVA